MAGFGAMLLNVNTLKSKVINMHHHMASYLLEGNSLSLRWNIALMYWDLGATWCKCTVTGLFGSHVTHLGFVVEFSCLKDLVHFLFSCLRHMPPAIFLKSNKSPSCISHVALMFSCCSHPVWPVCLYYHYFKSFSCFQPWSCNANYGHEIKNTQ